MSDLKHRKSAVVDVPGLVSFTAETEKPANSASAPQTPPHARAQNPSPRLVLSALDQMYDYFGV